jgi:mannose-6-phosphate isomerase-like protein (cupin superfamily)
MTATLLPVTVSATPAPTTIAQPTTAPRQSTGNAAIAISLALRPDLWRPLVRYQEETRWTRLLDPALVADALDPDLHDDLAAAEVWLLSWVPGQATALHDHGPSAGAFAVARGVLSERVVGAGRGGRRPREVTGDLGVGRVRYFGPQYVHQVRNAGSEPAVSVHVYAPRLSVMNTYRVEHNRLERIGTELAGVDW